MAKTISKSVGRAGANRKPDVLTIQDLLNQVPSAKGGAAPKLKLDGLCGAKTKNAISRFQLKHFGWKGADGLVEPQRQTIAKLNELTAKTPPPSKPVPPGTRPTEPPPLLSTRFKIVDVGEANDFMDEERDFFFRIIDLQNANFPQTYWLGPPGGFSHVKHRAVITYANHRRAKTFIVPAPGRAIEDLECRAIYQTMLRKKGGRGPSIRTRLFLRMSPRVIAIEMKRPMPFGQSVGSDRPIFQRQGQFQLVEAAFQFVDDRVLRI